MSLSKLKAEMSFKVLMRRKNIYHLLNSSVLKGQFYIRTKPYAEKGDCEKLFHKSSDFRKLKSKKQNSEIVL